MVLGERKNRKREVKTDELVHTLKKLSQTKRPGVSFTLHCLLYMSGVKNSVRFVYIMTDRSGDKEARRKKQRERSKDSRRSKETASDSFSSWTREETSCMEATEEMDLEETPWTRRCSQILSRKRFLHDYSC